MRVFSGIQFLFDILLGEDKLAAVVLADVVISANLF